MLLSSPRLHSCFFYLECTFPLSTWQTPACSLLFLTLIISSHHSWGSHSKNTEVVCHFLLRLKAKGEGGSRGWDGYTASPTQRTRVWANSGRQWRTAEPGALQSVSSQRVRHDLATEQQPSPLLQGLQWPSCPSRARPAFPFFVVLGPLFPFQQWPRAHMSQQLPAPGRRTTGLSPCILNTGTWKALGCLLKEWQRWLSRSFRDSMEEQQKAMPMTEIS